MGEEILVGRGSTCHITIDDPMLSRRHVRFDLSGSEPAVEDLQSRNGTQLNGRPLVRRAILQDGDRIRIGVQELVFLVPSAVKKDFRTTSGLTFCIGCAVPYPSVSVQCPHCGAVPTADAGRAPGREVTASGWTFHLLCQVVGRAIENGRLADAERMMSRGVAELEEQLDAGAEVEPKRIAGLAECAARLGCALRSPRWMEVAAKLYAKSGERASPEVVALLEALPFEASLVEAVDGLRRAGSDTRQAS